MGGQEGCLTDRVKDQGVRQGRLDVRAKTVSYPDNHHASCSTKRVPAGRRWEEVHTAVSWDSFPQSHSTIPTLRIVLQQGWRHR